MLSLTHAILDKAPQYTATRSGVASGLQSLFGGGNVESALKAYGSVGTLFAIVSVIGEAMALQDWKLIRGQEEARHPAADLWERPNEFYTQEEFIESSQQHFDLVGEMWWVIGRSTFGGGPPLELWPVRPDKMIVVPSADKFIAGYIYRSPDGEQVPLSTEDVIFIKRPNPLDPYRGLGPVQAIMMDLDAERFSAAWNRQFFLNSAEPGGIIEFDRNLDDAEWEEFTQRWREQHQGVSNAHRVAILERATWKDRSFSQRDMQFTMLRQMNREVIREAFAFPKPILGSVENVNKANALAAEITFARWIVKPRLQRIKQALNAKLLPLYGVSGKGLKFEHSNPVPQDVDQLVDQAVALVSAGFDPEETLAVLGLPPISYSGNATVSQGDALPVRNIVAIPQCPECGKRVGRNIQAGGELFCTRCKQAFTVG